MKRTIPIILLTTLTGCTSPQKSHDESDTIIRQYFNSPHQAPTLEDTIPETFQDRPVDTGYRLARYTKHPSTKYTGGNRMIDRTKSLNNLLITLPENRLPFFDQNPNTYNPFDDPNSISIIGENEIPTPNIGSAIVGITDEFYFKKIEKGDFLYRPYKTAIEVGDWFNKNFQFGGFEMVLSGNGINLSKNY